MLLDKLLELKKIDRTKYRELKIEQFERFRKRAFNAFDIYKSNVLYGIETETNIEKLDIIDWYEKMKNKINYLPVNVEFPSVPEKIKKYM